MKFGICGYGNLGKAIEKVITEKGGQIVGIFSRRSGIESASKAKVYSLDEAKDFIGKIDVMFMCGGSQEDLLWQSPQMCKYFNIVDTFDTHAKIAEHKNALEKVAKSSGHVAIYSCGWDPGLFSLIRGLAASIFENSPQTFWGKGVSQGHSEALRNISGIKDALQFTVPNKEILKKIKQNPAINADKNRMHERHCYICLDGTRSQEEIEEEIRNTENYFKGQEVKIFVCSQKKIDELKQKMFHQGIVIGGDKNSSMQFAVKMENNPQFTANIMYAYANATKKLESGAYNLLDIPVKYLDNNSKLDRII